MSYEKQILTGLIKVEQNILSE